MELSTVPWVDCRGVMARAKAWGIVVAAAAGGCGDAGVLQLDSSAGGSTAPGPTSSVGDSGVGGVDSETDTHIGTETNTDTSGESDSGDPEGCWPESPAEAVFHVSVDGVDAAAGGTVGAPWATLAFAVAQVPDGAVIEVGPGEYVGANDLVGRFEAGIVVRAQPRYLARLRNDTTVVTFADTRGVTLEGFDIAHTPPVAGPYLVHIMDGVGEPGGVDTTTRIVLRDNIIHDSFNNDLLKVDSGTSEVDVVGNVFYNQGGADEHVDINAAQDVLLTRNIFFNDFAASGRANESTTSSFVLAKDADGSADGVSGASDVTIDGNIFMSWQGTTSSNFVQLAERGNPVYGARNIVVQNNLMLGNGPDGMRAPFGVKGAADVLFRSNTVVGDFVANAFAFRLNVEGDSPPNDGIALYNNIWSAPGGTMGDLTDTELGQPLQNFVLDTNVYWNGGAPIPVDDTDTVNVSTDANAIVGDPVLPGTAFVNPVWDPEAMAFGGGASSICDAFDGLVAGHGTPGDGGVGVGTGLATQMPARDILGRDRTGNDVGAVAVP